MKTIERAPSGSVLVAFAVLAAAFSRGCGPSPDDPLPPESDLYAYSLAVATKARLRCPGSKAMGLFGIAQVHERFGMVEKAISGYREVIEEQGGHAESYRRIGFLQSQLNQMNKALANYQAALRCSPNLPGVYTRIGLILIHQGQPVEATRALRQEIRSGNSDAETHYTLGLALQKQSKHAGAIDAFRKAIDLAPKMRSAYYSLAQSLRAEGKTQEAEDTLKQFERIKSQEDARSQEKPTKDDNRGKLASFASATWLDATSMYIREGNRRGIPRKQRDQFLRWAIEAAKEARRLDPQSAMPWQALMDIYRSIGQMDRVEKLCAQAHKTFENDPMWSYRFARLSLELAEKDKSVDEDRYRQRVTRSYELLKEATAKLPDMGVAHLDLATLLLFHYPRKLKYWREALDHALQAIRTHPTERAFDILAFAYLQNGRGALAEKTLLDGLKEFPRSQTLQDRLQKLLERRKTSFHSGVEKP